MLFDVAFGNQRHQVIRIDCQHPYGPEPTDAVAGIAVEFAVNSLTVFEF